MNKIIVEVSVGELLDKISILEIKQEKIKDHEKLKFIKNEHAILKKQLENNVKTDQKGYMVLGQKCNHNYDIFSCGPKTKVMILKINEDGNELDEKLLSGLYFYEAGTAMSLANTHSGGYVFVTEPRNGGNVWIRKWGGSEETMNIKKNPGGLGGESIMRTNDNGFIISTAGGTIIKTDSNLSY